MHQKIEKGIEASGKLNEYLLLLKKLEDQFEFHSKLKLANWKHET